MDPRFDFSALLRRTTELAIRFISSLPDRPVGSREDAPIIAERLRVPFPEQGEDPWVTVERLARDVDAGLVASAGPRYYGFVVGGALPASVAADWLTAAWDQNAAIRVMSPAAAAAEEVAGEWMKQLLGIPADAGFGLTTGAGLANAVGFAAGRHKVLAQLGWDVEKRGLYGAPEIQVIIGEEAHSSAFLSLQYLGLGRERVTRIPADASGCMLAEPLAAALRAAQDSPVIVAAQAGNVNTGGCDPFEAIADAVDRHPNAWLHVDGAFGLWAAVVPELRHLVRGVERADSWATDAHKWLNVGYDCGFVATRDPDAHRAAMSLAAPYLMLSERHREPLDWVLDSSRRARGFALYAVLRSLGRSGVQDLIQRCCRLAKHMADRLSRTPDVQVLNDVQLNQVLVRFGDDDERTRAVISRVQREGAAWLGGTTWRGKGAMRISVSGWATNEADADQTVDAILRAAKES